MAESAQQFTQDAYTPGRVKALAEDISGRRYPDVTACALFRLLATERLRSRPGHAAAREWGHGPHHQELARLGLVTIGEPENAGGCRPVDLTTLGRDVARIIEEKSARQ